MLPLNLDALPSKNELDGQLAVLGGNAAIVDDDVH